MAGYSSHYKLITDAIWAANPSVHVVASGRWRWPGGHAVGNPCLAGARCDEWDDHYYRTPDAMAALHTTYDTYNRSWPSVFVGEFAANQGHRRTLRAAVAESLFMIGFERNADVVHASSFAPLLNNLHGTQWPYNLINFNGTDLFALPSCAPLRAAPDPCGTCARACTGACRRTCTRACTMQVLCPADALGQPSCLDR